MTDKSRALEILARLANDERVTLDELDLCAKVIRGTPKRPPEGSVKMRIMVSRIERDENWYGVAEVFDAITPNPQPDRKATHAAIIEAWIPPVVVPVVEGRVACEP